MTTTPDQNYLSDAPMGTEQIPHDVDGHLGSSEYIAEFAQILERFQDWAVAHGYDRATGLREQIDGVASSRMAIPTISERENNDATGIRKGQNPNLIPSATGAERASKSTIEPGNGITVWPDRGIKPLPTNGVVRGINSPDVATMFRLVSDNLQAAEGHFTFSESAGVDKTFTLGTLTSPTLGFDENTRYTYPSIGSDGPSIGTQRGSTSDTSLSIVIIRSFP
jgi:hypothetical protein